MPVQLTPQQQADLAQVMYGLAQNPQTRKDVAKLVAKLDPKRAASSFRDVVQEDKFAALERKIDEKLDISGARAAKAKQDEQRAELASRYGEDHMKGIDEVAVKYGISDLKAAAVLYANENPESDPTLGPPQPDRRPGATWEFPTVRGKDGKDLGFREFASDLRGHSLNEAYRTITDFKNKSLSPAFRR